MKRDFHVRFSEKFEVWSLLPILCGNVEKRTGEVEIRNDN